MRHKVRGRKLSRERDQRRLMFRNLLISLVEHERIATTLIKAKELRSIAERVITYGKKGEVHHRRLTYGILQDRTMVKKVFDELAPRYNEVNGGYTRVLKNGYRKGDMAPMAIIEFVGTEKKKLTKEKQKSESKS